MEMTHRDSPRRLKKAALQAVVVLAAASAAFTSLRWSAPLKDLLAQGASGTVTVEKMGRMPGERQLSVDVWRLKPDSVYSVWFLNEDGTTEPAGLKPNDFKTDGTGNGRYTTLTYQDIVDRWRYITVDLHPGGDPEDIKDRIPSLRGDLRYYSR